MTSEFLHHEPCPRCLKMGLDNAGDNLGVWSDGHKWCFSCGYYLPCSGLTVTELAMKLKQQEKRNKYHGLTLPDDCNSDLPEMAQAWLNKFGITQKEILKNGILWSQSHEQLIFPCFDGDSNLTFYQGRSFAKDKTKTRYLSRGLADGILHILGDNAADRVVLVEDIISAIKVSRQVAAMPLWGSNISNDLLLRLSGQTKNLIVWLDYDKSRYSIASSVRAKPLFESSRSIVTKLDPKEYNDDEINFSL